MIGCKKATVMNPPLETVPLTFTRVGETYGWDGHSIPEHTPIYEHKVPDGPGYKLVQGCGIFESRTNILPAAISQSMSEPYTTAALTGTYTFMVQGEGSITLSGGATGTISFNNSVTVTLSNATVTLTPTGTVTLVQVINKAYTLPWGLGGVSIQAETLTAPSSVLNIDTDGYANLFPANVADGGDTLNNGTGMLSNTYSTIARDTDVKYSGSGSFKMTNIAGGNGSIGTDYLTAVAGVVYSVNVKLKTNCQGGIRLYLRFFNDSNTQLGNNYTSVLYPNEFDEIKIENKTAPTGTTKFKVFAICNSPDEGNNIWWDEAQFSTTFTAKPWIPGGSQVNAGTGTIECEVYFNSALKDPTLTRNLIIHRTTGNANLIRIAHYSSNWYIDSSNNIESLSRINYADSNTPLNSLYKFGCTFDNSQLKGYITGNVVGTPISSPNLPSAKNIISIGHLNGTGQINTIIRNIFINRPKKADTEMAARGSLPEGQAPRPGPGAMLYAPLMSSLKAYKVRA